MASNDHARGVSRRGLLRASGVALGAGVLSGTAAGRTGSVAANVGYATDSGRRATLSRATAVVRRFAFDAVSVRLPERAVDRLASRSDIRYVERDATKRASVPTRLPNAAASSRPTETQVLPYGVDRVDADVAHANGYTGSGASVAIIDTGVDSTHPDLGASVGAGGAFVPGVGRVEELGLPRWVDDNYVGHGTHCAGIADGTDNERGVVGVSTEATLHAVKSFTVIGSGFPPTLSASVADAAAGIAYVARRGWDVANMSFGFPEPSGLLADAIAYAHERGVLLVAAAGNEGAAPMDAPANMVGSTVGYPAAYDEVIAVSATDRTDRLAEFSSTGPAVDLAAPGVDVLSASVRYPNRYLGEKVFPVYSRLSGTSFAAPHVAGAGALLMARGYSNTEARDRLEATAEDIGLGPAEAGNGLLDAAAALGLDSSDNL